MTASCPACVICTTEREATHGYLCTGDVVSVEQVVINGDADYCLVDDEYACCRINHPTEESQCRPLTEETS